MEAVNRTSHFKTGESLETTSIVPLKVKIRPHSVISKIRKRVFYFSVISLVGRQTIKYHCKIFTFSFFAQTGKSSNVKICLKTFSLA